MPLKDEEEEEEGEEDWTGGFRYTSINDRTKVKRHQGWYVG